jgi:hypothetical protein
MEPWAKQLEIINSVRDNRKTTVRSCNGAGKTYLLPRLALWFLHAFPHSMVINTAPTWRQVENQYWRHFNAAHARSKVPIGGDVFKTKYEIDEDWFAMGVSVKRTEDFQGWHSKSIMVIVDEASGVSPLVFEAVNGIVSGGETVRLVYIGNPNQNQGDFHDSFSDPSFSKIHISAFDLPNVKEKRQVIPGLSTLEWVEDMKRKYGEDHDVYRVRVKGEPPVKGDDILISIQAVADAIGADRERYGEEEFLGLDVARFGSDNSAFVYRKGNFAKVIEVIPRNDLMELAGKAKVHMKVFPKAKLIVDLGMGAGVVDRLKEQSDVSDRVFGVNFGASPKDKETYVNHRIEMWDAVKSWTRDAILEPHDDWYQLAKPKYKYTSTGQLQLESKEEMKKRGIQSPDIGDGLALTFATQFEGESLGVVWI